MNQENLLNKVKFIKQYTKQKRIGKLSNPQDTNSYSPFVMALQPLKIKKQQYDKLKKYSYLWQKLIFNSLHDKKLIFQTFQNSKNDPIVYPLLKMLQKITVKFQKPHFNFFRSDYFLTKQQQIKIIQYNILSISMAGISQKFSQAHQQYQKQNSIIQNNSTLSYAKQLSNFYKQNKLQGIMIIVVQQNQINYYDQLFLINQIKKQINIDVQRVLLKDIQNQVYLNQQNDLFYKNNNKKISIVYYRSGYSSRQIIPWQGMMKCHQSNAINIPSIQGFLMNTKKMQTKLSRKQIMSKYLSQQQTQFLMYSVPNVWDIKDQNDKLNLINLVQKVGIQQFILKPNQQGGRNNIFKKQAYEKLKQLQIQQLNNFILNQILYPRQYNTFLVNQELQQKILQPQVSIYGVIWNKQQRIINQTDGYLVRCKIKGINQGGLMAGTGILCTLKYDQNQQNPQILK